MSDQHKKIIEFKIKQNKTESQWFALAKNMKRFLL